MNRFLFALIFSTAVFFAESYGAEKPVAKGVRWNYQYESKYYTIYTNISSTLSKKAGGIADKAYESAIERLDIQNNDPRFIKNLEKIFDRNKRLVTAYDDGTEVYELPDKIKLTEWQVNVGTYEFEFPDGRKFAFWKKGMYGQRVNVFLCRNAEELDRVIKDSVPGTGRGAWYVSEGMIVVRMQKDNENAGLDDFVHEIHHQVMNYALYNPPVWLDEGLAMYAEIDSDGRYRAGEVRERFLTPCIEAIENGTFVSIADLIRMNYNAYHFSDLENLHYSQSWALVHFLKHSVHKDIKGRFKDYYTRLRTGEDGVDAFKAVYNTEILEKEWRRYLKSIEKRLKKQNTSALTVTS